MLKRFLVLFLVILLGTTVSFSQQQFTTESKKAIKSYQDALRLFNTKLYDQALAEVEKAISKDGAFVEAYLLCAYIYIDKNNAEKSIEFLEKGIAVSPSYFPTTFFTLATIEMSLGNYESAIKNYGFYLDRERADGRTRAIAKHQIDNCNFAIHAIKNPVPFKPVNMGPNINTKLAEYYPAITVDGKRFIYTRRLPDARSSMMFQEDFYVSNNEGGAWQKSYNIGPPINTYMNEGAATISQDGKLLIFVGCEDENGYGADRNGHGSCDLFYVFKEGNRWSRPNNMGPVINSRGWDSQPSFSSDGRTLYFVSGRKGGLGGKDIWMSRLGKDNVWSVPMNLGPNINTKGGEESVFIHPDNRTIYFASDGHVGMGGLDIYMSKKDENGNWGKAVNLGYPINTSKNENSLLVDAKGQLAYFGSDRPGGLGGIDLYQFELPAQFKPELVTYMKGVVYDAKTKKKLRAKFELIDLASEKVMVESFSDGSNGEFLVSLPYNKNYALNVSREGYMFYSENFSLKESSVNKPYLMDVPLQPIVEGGVVVLNNIFFETAAFDLKTASKVELKKLIEFLNANNSLIIEIGGHTDNVGSSASNKELSNQRAMAVRSHLIEFGIAANRISFKGYGDEKPVESNDTEEGRALNRRTEFTVISK
ncbi:MAG: PD40 domain-containing protein [Flavobacteriales bacterium]|nr:PD40 domain-containing protein [Flavobacteriales bacterium]